MRNYERYCENYQDREYKVNGGNMSWNDFRKNNGDKTICSAI